MNLVFRQAKRLVIFIIGITVLLIGVALLVLPGPALVVIPLGLAILATEFIWARRWLKRLRQQATTAGKAAANFWKSSSKSQDQNHPASDQYQSTLK